jgi:hypothetical protein
MTMKSLLSNAAYLLIVFALGCSQDDPTVEEESNFTGRDITYALESASEFNISGTAVLKERIDLSTDIIIKLNKTFQENQSYPRYSRLDPMRETDLIELQ